MVLRWRVRDSKDVDVKPGLDCYMGAFVRSYFCSLTSTGRNSDNVSHTHVQKNPATLQSVRCEREHVYGDTKVNTRARGAMLYCLLHCSSLASLLINYASVFFRPALSADGTGWHVKAGHGPRSPLNHSCEHVGNRGGSLVI